jgi:hypothetical protein
LLGVSAIHLPDCRCGLRGPALRAAHNPQPTKISEYRADWHHVFARWAAGTTVELETTRRKLREHQGLIIRGADNLFGFGYIHH